MIILIPLIAALIVSYIIWSFNSKIMGKNLSISKVATWVVIATFILYVTFSGLSFLIESL